MGSWEVDRFSGQRQCNLAGIRLLLFNQCTRGCYCSTLESWDREPGSRHSRGCSKVQFWELENGSGPLRPLHLSSSSWAWKPGQGVGNACSGIRSQTVSGPCGEPKSTELMGSTGQYWTCSKIVLASASALQCQASLQCPGNLYLSRDQLKLTLFSSHLRYTHHLRNGLCAMAVGSLAVTLSLPNSQPVTSIPPLVKCSFSG